MKRHAKVAAEIDFESAHHVFADIGKDGAKDDLLADLPEQVAKRILKETWSGPCPEEFGGSVHDLRAIAKKLEAMGPRGAASLVKVRDCLNSFRAIYQIIARGRPDLMPDIVAGKIRTTQALGLCPIDTK